MSAHHDISADRAPAYTGLIVGAAAVFAILFGVVKFTNAKYAGEHAREKPAAAEAPKK